MTGAADPNSNSSQALPSRDSLPLADKPRVTVLMPVRNEGAYIDKSLGSVLAQSYGLEHLQILVVDGMSDDDTRDRVTSLQRQHPDADIEILDNPGRIAPCALNVGLRHARGEVVVRVDGHCEVGRHYVAHGVAHLKNGADGVGGPLETVGETVTARAIAGAMSSRFGVGGVAFRTTETDAGTDPPLDLAAVRQVDTVAFPAYRRSITERAGFFDEEFVRNQDDEYNYRLRKLGARIVLALDMPAKYYSRANFKKLWRQYFQYGFWKVRVLQRHPRQMSRRQFVPAIFVGALIGCGLLSIFEPRLGLPLLAAVVGSYSLANLGATWFLSRRQTTHRAAVAARLPLAFALIHLGYGSGFLVGLLRFAGRSNT